MIILVIRVIIKNSPIKNLELGNLQDIMRRQSNEDATGQDFIYSSSLEPKFSTGTSHFNMNKSLRNNHSIEGSIMNATAKRKMKLRREYNKYYKSTKPIYLSIKPKGIKLYKYII